MRKPAVRILKLVALNLLLLLVLLESVSLVIYFFKTGELFYARDRSRTNTTRSQFEAAVPVSNKNPALAYQLHPYFGFVAAEGYDAKAYITSNSLVPHHTNNYGFFCPYDFPFKKTNKNQFVVGVFGGSVARFLTLYELENQVLTKALQSLPAYRNREIVILNFAAGSYKQPQQLLVLNYFLSLGQELDMVINVDGFNDVLFPYLNNRSGVDMSMPNAQIELPLIDLANKDLRPGALTVSLEILQLRTQLRDGLTKLENCRLATCYSLRWMWVKYLFNQYQKRHLALSELDQNESGHDSLIHLSRIQKPLADSEVYDQLADLWTNSSVAMGELLSARGILYFHFIQPNQYYPTKRQFTEEEKRIAFSDGNPSKEVVPPGYSKLLARVTNLQKSGVKIFDETGAFDDVKDLVYIDNCCHYTKTGNGIFAARVAERITTSLNNETAPDAKSRH